MTTASAEATVPNPIQRTRLSRAILLATVFVCAACGLVYELALITLGAYLIGNTAAQASIVLSVMVFAMGLGALAAKPLQKRPALSFALIELALAGIGGLSVVALYASFAWLHLYTAPLVTIAFLIGGLVGAEIPLLMELLQRIKKQSAGTAVADLNAADYLGGLIGGLAFPFLLLPFMGQIRGAVLVGAVNAIAGLVLVFAVFRPDLTRLGRILTGSLAALVAVSLVSVFVFTKQIEASARQEFYSHPIIYSDTTQYQDIVLTESISPFQTDDFRMFLNGDLQFSSVDEYRYHEALVHPIMDGPRDDVLILGGGDGLAVREVVRYPDVDTITLVDLDPAVTELAMSYERLVDLNQGAMHDDRVDVVNDDAFTWLREQNDTWDTIIVDMPDPDSTELAKLYSVEFYSLARQALGDEGRMTIQSSSPYFAPDSYWTVASTLEEAGFDPVSYWVSVPTFGDWGFHSVSSEGKPTLSLDDSIGPLRSMNSESLAAAQSFPVDRQRRDLPPNTLIDPVIVEYSRTEWKHY
ncbi:polyamine aminopropyltransferase [Haloglycomyces albus]|uniref:polyamine aminopropyltransferase n=1 Tax=Haloglycomyces albus TaxID=526067 RepID=UPI00046D7DEA|nr:polyamine aminopropyltransferase [Haloglycomyces albus]